MSHFIKTSDQTNPAELLSGQVYEIKAPHRRALSRQFDFKRFSVDESAKTIAKIVARQQKYGIMQNEWQLQYSLITLKKRIKGFGTSEQQHVPFGNSQNFHNKKLTCGPTESIDVKKKYNAELTVKFNALKECVNNQAYRREITKCTDSRFNAIGYSPNFNKMNYLITRAREGDKEKQIFNSANILRSKTGEQIIGLSRPLKQSGGYKGLLSISTQSAQS